MCGAWFRLCHAVRMIPISSGQLWTPSQRVGRLNQGHGLLSMELGNRTYLVLAYGFIDYLR
jgi:hypothetical protein